MSRWCLLTLTDDLFDLGTNTVEGDAEGLKTLRRNTFALFDEAKEDVFGADVVVIEHASLFLGKDNDPAGSIGKALKHRFCSFFSGDS